VALLLATAYPDRIARQRAKGGDRYLLVNGFGATIGRRSAVHDREFVVAVEMAANAAADGTIHGCCSLTLDLIRQLFGNVIERNRTVAWDEAEARVTAAEEELLGSLVLSRRPMVPDDEEAVPALLAAIATDPELKALPWTDAARQFQARLALLALVCPEKGLPPLDNRALRASLSTWLGPSLGGIRSCASLQRIDLLSLLKGMFSWEQLRLVDEGAPTHLTVPSGSKIRIEYASGEPLLSVKLQEMFGLSETPAVAWGRVPLLIHLLSPAQRPIQVTRDLKSFWDKTYPEVKKELKGRYPKHPWPDDPWNAIPTRKTKKSMVS
jgi:ATP-dependent helicase HrpB